MKSNPSDEKDFELHKKNWCSFIAIAATHKTFSLVHILFNDEKKGHEQN